MPKTTANRVITLILKNCVLSLIPMVKANISFPNLNELHLEMFRHIYGQPSNEELLRIMKLPGDNLKKLKLKGYMPLEAFLDAEIKVEV